MSEWGRRDTAGDVEAFAWSNPGRLSIAVIAVCAVLGVLTIPGPDAELGLRLLAWGAKSNSEVAEGQWWRLLSAAFLHGGWEHLVFNAYALFVVGSVVERAFGPARFAAIYVVTAIAGSLASYALSDAMSVGASGAIFGLMGAGFLTLRRGHKEIRGVLSARHLTALMGWAAYSLVLGFINPGIDNAAHVGGLVAGVAAAAVLPSGALATTLATLGAAALAWTGVEVSRSVAALPRLVAYDRGLAAYARDDLAEAERQYTAALPFPAARLNRAVVRLDRDDAAAALADLDTVLASNPTGETLDLAHLNRAAALLQLDRPEEALRNAAEAARSSNLETRQRALLSRGGALVKLGRHQEALAPLAEAGTAADSGLAHSAHFRRARALSALGRHAEAAAAYREAAHRADVGISAWWNAHVEHHRAGERREARDALDSALATARRAVERTGERDAEALEELAVVLSELGSHLEAAHARRKARALSGRPPSRVP